MKKGILFLSVFFLLNLMGCNTPEQTHTYHQLNLLLSFCAMIAMFISLFYSYKLFNKKVSFRVDLILYAVFILSFLRIPIIPLVCMVYNIFWCRKQLNNAEKIPQDIKTETNKGDSDIRFSSFLRDNRLIEPETNKEGNELPSALMSISALILLTPVIFFSIFIMCFAFDAPSSQENIKNWFGVILVITILCLVHIWLTRLGTQKASKSATNNSNKKLASCLEILFGLIIRLSIVALIYCCLFLGVTVKSRIAIAVIVVTLILVSILLRKPLSHLRNSEPAVPQKEIDKKIIREFFDAILEQDEVKIQELLNEFPELAKTPYEENGNTALHVCAVNNYTRVAELILACDDTARSCKNADGEYPYEIAIANGYNQLAQKLR